MLSLFLVSWLSCSIEVRWRKHRWDTGDRISILQSYTLSTHFFSLSAAAFYTNSCFKCLVLCCYLILSVCNQTFLSLFFFLSDVISSAAAERDLGSARPDEKEVRSKQLVHISTTPPFIPFFYSCCTFNQFLCFALVSQIRKTLFILHIKDKKSRLQRCMEVQE